MKRHNILSAVAGLLMASALVGCDSEKDLIIYEGNLPIKTSALYMVGDATPVGWNIEAPYQLERSEENDMVFFYEGTLYVGELKLCLVGGDWGNPFIRPVEAGTPIGREAIVDQEFIMHAGDPDNKWNVVEEGRYLLSFDLRNWTMSSTYLGESEGPVFEPIQTDELYMVGSATPVDWNIDDPYKLVKAGEYRFIFDGELKIGEMKACTETGNWDAPFIRPTGGNVVIDKDGVSAPDMMYTVGPDYKWQVKTNGIYHIEFDLENGKIAVECKKDLTPIMPDDPLLEATMVYLVGSATPNGWDIGNATEMEQDPNNPHVFTWTGALVLENGNTSEFKACLVRDTSWGCPFIRPTSDNITVSSAGVSATDFMFSVGDPDYKWQVTEAGRYTITLDLENKTIAVTYLD